MKVLVLNADGTTYATHQVGVSSVVDIQINQYGTVRISHDTPDKDFTIINMGMIVSNA